MNQSQVVIIVAGLTTIFGACALLHPRWLRLKKHLKDLRTPGFIPAPPTVEGRRRQLRLSSLLTWVFVGKVKILGLENLSKLPTGCSYQITPNHSHFADIFVLPMLVHGCNPRYMAAPQVMGGLCGLLGLLLAPLGAFAASRKAAAEILCSGQCMVIFPEGWTYLDGNMGRCRKGAVQLCRLAAKAQQQPSYLLPIYVRYGRYPGSWITKLPIRLQYAILFLGFVGFRSGATIKIGAPIASSALPSDDTEASQLLRQEILILKPRML